MIIFLFLYLMTCVFYYIHYFDILFCFVLFLFFLLCFHFIKMSMREREREGRALSFISHINIIKFHFLEIPKEFFVFCFEYYTYKRQVTISAPKSILQNISFNYFTGIVKFIKLFLLTEFSVISFAFLYS